MVRKITFAELKPISAEIKGRLKLLHMYRTLPERNKTNHERTSAREDNYYPNIIVFQVGFPRAQTKNLAYNGKDLMISGLGRCY